LIVDGHLICNGDRVLQNIEEKTVFLVSEVFTPATPARVSFVERESVNDKLVNALQTPGKQIVVYGHSGTGKTTLLVNKLDQLYSGHITTRCMKGTTVDELMIKAFDKLDQFYVAEQASTSKNSIDVGIEASYLNVKSQLKGTQQREQSQKTLRVLPIQLSAENLAAFLGEKELCWVIEDFHKVDDAEKTKLSQLMKVFMDCADDYPKVRIIAIGAVETARQVVEFDPEMRNRVSEIEVSLMTEAEISAVIDKGANALNLAFPDTLKRVIAKYSSGLGAACHDLCLKLCNAVGLIETSVDSVVITGDHFEKAITNYVEECSDSIRNQFEKAQKLTRKSSINHGEIILEALSHFDDLGVDRFKLLKQIQKNSPSYSDPVLKKQLQSLLAESKGAVVKLSDNSGLYSFSNPLYRVYALSRHHKTNGHAVSSISIENVTFADLIKMLERKLVTLSPPPKVMRIPKL
jgi:Cdc6-like AAA superfamily ATPase